MVWQGEFHNKGKNGEYFWESATISGIRDEDGITTHYLAVKEDITERKLQDMLLEEARLAAEHLASTDKLTGLPNRMIFSDRVKEAIRRSSRQGNKFAVLFFDFDRFKVVNDSLGHDLGDALLCDIAALFRQELRQTDTVARFGGDEFVVLLVWISILVDCYFDSQHSDGSGNFFLIERSEQILFNNFR